MQPADLRQEGPLKSSEPVVGNCYITTSFVLSTPWACLSDHEIPSLILYVLMILRSYKTEQNWL